MKRRTTGAVIVTVLCLFMLAIAALTVDGCTACFGGGWCSGDETPADTQVTPIPHPVAAEPLTPAEPAPEPIPEPEEPTEVEEPIASEPLPPEAGSGPGSGSGPTPPNEGEPGPDPTVPPPGPAVGYCTHPDTWTGDEVGDHCGCARREGARGFNEDESGDPGTQMIIVDADTQTCAVPGDG